MFTNIFKQEYLNAVSDSQNLHWWTEFVMKLLKERCYSVPKVKLKEECGGQKTLDFCPCREYSFPSF